jgi:two-component system cell cycle sensor histidine kinase/response regulator CckA
MRDDDQRLRQAIRVGNIGIFDHDHEAGRIFWSLELRQMYGWDPDEPVTLEKIVSHVHPEDAPRVLAALRRAHDPAGDGAFDIEHRILDRQGRLRWVQTRSLTTFGSVSDRLVPSRTIGAVQDATARRVAEERLRVLEEQLMQAQKMESIGRLAGGVAHDFNNLLTVISAGLDFTLQPLAADDPTRARLADVVEATQSAAALTRQLLAFSRKEIIAPKVLDLNEVIRRTQKMIQRLIGEDVELKVICGDGLTPIRFDPGQAEQILINLAVNARDAMPTGGRLTIETSNVWVDGEAASAQSGGGGLPHALLTVSDNGAGMSDEVRAHLFEPFFTTKGPGRGTGMGLPMVYGAVQQNGGRIEVHSEPNAGSTFRIYLPGAEGLPEPRPAARLPATNGRREATTLLVEDDSRVRRLATQALTSLGYRVHAFGDGISALRALPSLRPVPDLLITDVIMPGMNGTVLATRGPAALPQIRVLFVSGYTEDFIVDRGVLETGIEFLAKPYSLEQLAQRAREILDD